MGPARRDGLDGRDRAIAAVGSVPGRQAFGGQIAMHDLVGDACNDGCPNVTMRNCRRSVVTGWLFRRSRRQQHLLAVRRAETAAIEWLRSPARTTVREVAKPANGHMSPSSETRRRIQPSSANRCLSDADMAVMRHRPTRSTSNPVACRRMLSMCLNRATAALRGSDLRSARLTIWSAYRAARPLQRHCRRPALRAPPPRSTTSSRLDAHPIAHPASIGSPISNQASKPPAGPADHEIKHDAFSPSARATR